MSKSFRDLIVWQRSKAFAVNLYQITNRFPKHELFGLTNQIRRAGVSIPSNLSEGHMRASHKIFANHISISLGSAAELSTQLEIALDIGYLSQEAYHELIDELTQITKMLHALLRSVKSN